MDISYPDIIGEYYASPKRFETNGVQFVSYFDPAEIDLGQSTNMFLFLQNCLNIPIKVVIKIELPKKGGLFRGSKQILNAGKTTIELELSEAEAGLLTLPVVTTEHAEPGEYPIVVELDVTHLGEIKKRIRPPKSKSRLGKSPIDNMMGLNLVGTLGANYQEKSVKKASFSLEILDNSSEPDDEVDLEEHYEKIWDKDEFNSFNKAIREINLRQVKFQKDLTEDALYATMYGASVRKFADAGMAMRVGEAITMAKILTYTCQFFLKSSNRRNGLLTPIWERAFDTDTDTTNALNLLGSVGYYHILKLAIAISFGLTAQTIGRHAWSLTERQGVMHYIADNIEFGETTELDFLYLPLLMGGTLISKKIKMDGENVSHSLALMKQARKARVSLFADKDMAQAKKIYSHILKKA